MKAETIFKGLFILVAVCILCAIGLYVAGFVFLLANKLNPLTAGLGTFYQYWYYYHDDPLQKGHFIAAIGAAFIVVVVVPLVAIVSSMRNGRPLHGDARFATIGEVAKAGLFGEAGILVGKIGKKYLLLGGQLFAVVAAPTRSGKGVGIVIPNCLNFSDSLVVLDIKLENFNITSGYRKLYGHEVYKFEPFSEAAHTHGWNPLSYVSRNSHSRISDILEIGYVLYPLNPENKDSFFDDQARNLFVGLVLYLTETPELPCTIGEALRQSSGKGKPVKEYLTQMIAERDASDKPLSDECVDALMRFLSTSDNTLSSILASFNAPLGAFTIPSVDAATSRDDFDLRDVRKKRMTIYLGVTPNKLSQSRLLMNLFFSQLINLNTKELPEHNAALKYQCLLLCDEFTAIGKVDIINSAVGYIAGYNLRLLPIFQSRGQLISKYGEHDADTLVTNHALRVVFPPKELKDAKDVSETLGSMTVKSTSTGTSGKPMGGGTSRSENISDQRRDLMMPQELRELGQDKEIVLFENVKPIMAEKITYYDDPVFIDRLKEVSSTLGKIKGIPTREQLEGAIESGELRVVIPFIDLDLHLARVQTRRRFLTVDDLDGDTPINLDALVSDFSDLAELDDGLNPSQESVENLVTDFFSRLEDRMTPEDEFDFEEADEEHENEISLDELNEELAAETSEFGSQFTDASEDDFVEHIDDDGVVTFGTAGNDLDRPGQRKIDLSELER